MVVIVAINDRYDKGRVADKQEEIRKWEFELRKTIDEDDREWIRGQIRKLEAEIACIRANTC